MGLTDYVVLDVAGFTGDIHSDADYLLAGEGEGQGVIFARNLVEGILGCAVKLELNDIAVLRRLQHHVDAAIACVILCLDVHAQEFVQQPHLILVMVLEVLNQFVWRVGKE